MRPPTGIVIAIAISADVGARHVDGAGVGTAVLEKRGQSWKIVH